MRDRSDRIEERLERLERTLEELAPRVRAIESAVQSAGAQVVDTPLAAPHGAALTPGALEVAPVLALAGRTFVVLAGAYLLRALTESGLWSAPTGVTLGLLYAALWLARADRVGAAGRRLEGELHGATAVAIALPLVWEAATTREILPGGSGAIALAAVALLALMVAWWQRLHGLAWITTLGALAAGGALLVQTGAIAAYTVVFITLGIATLWLGYDRDWYGLRWPTALAADVTVAGLTARALVPQTGERPEVAIGAQLLLLGAYLVTIAARTLLRGRTVLPFEIAQASAALAVGLGGAMVVTGATGVGGLAVGLGALILGGGGYAVAFAFVARRQGRGLNFYFYTSLALALTLAGSQRVLAAPAVALVWAGLAVLMTWLGHRASRVTLAAHGAVCATAAAYTSGLLHGSVGALFSEPSSWPAAMPLTWAVLALVAVSASLPRPSADEWGRAARLPRAVCAALLILVGAGLLTHLVVVPLSTTATAGATATVRTGILAGAAILAALLGRYDRWIELGWFTYPILIAGAVKLLVDDLLHSPAAMLVVALALYGGALIVAPRLAGARHGRISAASPEVESAVH